MVLLRRKLYLFLYLNFVVLTAHGQTKEVLHQNLYWKRYYAQVLIKNDWAWQTELEDRRFFKNNRHQHFIIHSRVHYRYYPNADIAFGLTYSRQSPQDPNAFMKFLVPEIRPEQEMNFLTPVTARFSIHQRLRIDERFIRKNENNLLLKGFDFNLRFRYKLQANFQISRIESQRPSTLKVSNEIMINAGKKIVNNQFDQNRFFAGVEQKLNKNFSLELGYMHLYQQRASGYQFFDRDIIRMTLYHKFKL